MEIPLSRGLTAVIDDEDAPLISGHKWYALKPRNTWYARSNQGFYMHRLIMGLPRLSVDHINGNGLDNRRGNLRIATSAQQQMNTPSKGRHKLSKYKGVTIHVTRKQTRAGLHEYRRWMGQISIGPKKYAAYFQNEEAAAAWYNEMARKHFGEFARGNALREIA